MVIKSPVMNWRDGVDGWDGTERGEARGEARGLVVEKNRGEERGRESLGGTPAQRRRGVGLKRQGGARATEGGQKSGRREGEKEGMEGLGLVAEEHFGSSTASQDGRKGASRVVSQ